MKRPKRHQGRKIGRIRTRHTESLYASDEAKRIDTVLEQLRLGRHITQQRDPDTHRHKYLILVRMTQEGNRVMACRCGAYVLLERA